MTMMRRVTLPLIAVLALLALAAAGCGDTTARSGDDAARPGAGSSDTGDAVTGPLDGAYVATDVSGRSLVEGTRIRLILKGGQLSADAGCNQMSGQASVTDDRLVVTGLGMTEMGCEPGRMEQDGWVADLLTSGPRIATGPDGFTLTGDGVTARFATQEPPADASLEGTTWRLESVVEGDVASSAVGGGEGSAPRFRIDGGRVEGFDGCDELAGQVEVTADSIRAGGLGGTQRQCLVAGAPLADVLAGSTYVVEGDRLTLTRGGTSLVFRAG